MKVSMIISSEIINNRVNLWMLEPCESVNVRRKSLWPYGGDDERLVMVEEGRTEDGLDNGH